MTLQGAGQIGTWDKIFRCSCSYRMGAERWRSTTCLMCCATKMSASPPLEVLLKFFGNDSDFDREVGVTGSFQNHCPGSPIDKRSSLPTPMNALRSRLVIPILDSSLMILSKFQQTNYRRDLQHSHKIVSPCLASMSKSWSSAHPSSTVFYQEPIMHSNALRPDLQSISSFSWQRD